MSNLKIKVVSQHPHVLKGQLKIAAESELLPVLLEIMKMVEFETGYAWMVTSYLRQSPSHSRGVSLDIAPDIAESSKKYYAVYRGSDPVLYKREKLIRDLQRVASRFYSTKVSANIFIEPDHLHIQLSPFDEFGGHCHVTKWGIAKSCYSDTSDRSKLPLIKAGDHSLLRYAQAYGRIKKK